MHNRPLLRCGSAFLLSCLIASFHSAAQQPAASAVNFRTTSRIVYVDVVVRDSGGHVVHGLDQGSFILQENGRPQRIDLFEEHQGVGRKAALSAGAG
jgi:hypothetical protein